MNCEQAVNPAGTGTKACLHYSAIGSGRRVRPSWHMRLSRCRCPPAQGCRQIVRQRRVEADEFYAPIHPPQASADEKLRAAPGARGHAVEKQFYFFDVNVWFDGDNPTRAAA